ncbi:hypothetical protein TNCV_2655481 [Trichonephila clavipes]|nr:hypothetical protein TNCV_2655481 [Trichonephila clavipes]
MLEKVIENWTSRLDYIRASCGSPMPEIIFKINCLEGSVSSYCHSSFRGRARGHAVETVLCWDLFWRVYSAGPPCRRSMREGGTMMRFPVAGSNSNLRAEKGRSPMDPCSRISLLLQKDSPVRRVEWEANNRSLHRLPSRIKSFP